MGFVEVQKIVNLSPEKITEDEKENLFLDLTRLELNQAEVGTEDLSKLFYIAQEILRFKGDQVESLISELDNLAFKLGEVEAESQHRGYNKDVQGLRSPGSSEDKRANADTDYHRELLKMEIQNNQLMSELQEKEQELMDEKKELEKMTNRISTLAEENRSLRNELQATQQELTSSAATKSLMDDQEYPSMEKYHELTELLRQKNKHITQLLNDIEDVEKENIMLRDELSSIREELADGVEQMSKLSMERLSLSACVDELKANVSRLEHENAGLRNQIAELIIDKEKRDKQFEMISLNYETKLEQWKSMSQEKDNELTSLRIQSSSMQSDGIFDTSNHFTRLNDLTKMLAEREEKIVLLQCQLEQATVDLNESARLLEDLRETLNIYKNKSDKDTKLSDMKQQNKELEQYKDRVTILEAKARHAEEESFKKAQEVSELIIQLREYESGTYGLEEAMGRIKELQKQKHVRDSQIEQLVHNLNQLQEDVNLLEQENQILRERLGICISEPVVVDDISRMSRDRRNKLTELKEELEKCQNELLSHRLENRKLKKQISTLEADINFFRLKECSADTTDYQVSTEPGLISKYTKNLSVAIQSSFDEDYYEQNGFNSDRVQEIIDENESLRKGMHEILDSIKNKDVSSVVQIESETLERLLEALDSRHVNGWYQPAMRLQAHIHHLNGVNQRLREELHSYRQREDELLYKFFDVNKKLNESYTVLSDTKSNLDTQECESPSKLKIEDIQQSHVQLEKELENERMKNEALTEQVERYREKFVLIEEQLKIMNEQYDKEKESWSSLKATMQVEIDDAKNEIKILQLKLSEHEKTLETLKQSPEEINRAFIESKFSISSLKIELHQFSRKYDVLMEAERQMRLAKNEIADEMYSMKVSKDQEIVGLRKINDQLSVKLKNQITIQNECVNRIEYERVIRDLNELTVKHREVLQKQILIQSGKDKLIFRLQTEIVSLQTQRTDLEISLKLALEETLTLKSQTINEGPTEQVIALNKQVAELELEILNKKQRADHLDRMYELTKEQLTETEHRCKQLEDQLTLAVEANSQMQKHEAELRENLVKLPTATEFEELTRKLENLETDYALLSSHKNELEELAKIAQDQVKTLEENNKRQDFEFDSLQRRILELQSYSDEKVIIDRLTKDLLLLQQNGINASNETNNLKDKLSKSESEILQIKMKLDECENDYNKLKRDNNIKVRCVFAILYELQKRYLGSFPLVKEELCCESLMDCKEESYALTSLMLNTRPSSIFTANESSNEPIENIQIASSRESSHRITLKMQEKRLRRRTDDIRLSVVKSDPQQRKDFNMRLLNEGLQNKIQIYAERLERQDKLIARLEQEIIHADEQCEEFLLYWNPQSTMNFFDENDDEALNTKFTQTVYKEQNDAEPLRERKAVPEGKISNEHQNQDEESVEETRRDLQATKDELRKVRDRLTNVTTELKERELIISNKDKEIVALKQIVHQNGSSTDVVKNIDYDDDNSINKLALKATVNNLQNIITQKEEIIERLQASIKENGEKHSQTVTQLLSELKALHDAVDIKDQACNRLKVRLDALEKPPNEKRGIIDSCLTKIHKLEDELNQSKEKIEQLTNQLADSTSQVEQWSHTAEERLKTVQSMKHELDAKRRPASTTSENNKLSYSALLQVVKEKTGIVERQSKTIEELQKRLESREKLPGYRDRLKNEMEKYKKRIEFLEQQERENNAEIQRLRNQISNRPQSARRREILVTPKEEQLLKKIKILEEQVDEYVNKEKKWTETRRAQVDGELEKWQCKKLLQQNQEKLRQQIKDLTTSNKTLKLSNDRLKETIIRLEKERMALESKLKGFKSHTASMSIIEELQKTNNRLEEEVKMLHRSVELTAGSTSLADVIEAQERQIKALEIAQKGDFALVEEVERLNERKSQLQKYVMQLEGEKSQLKLENERLRLDWKSHNCNEVSKTGTRPYNEDVNKNQNAVEKERKTGDLEKAVLVLRRVVEKLQAENKRLYNSKMNQIQDSNQIEKMQIELQNLHGSYLDAIEKISNLGKELENAYEELETSHKIIERLRNGEEISNLRIQLAQKNRILNRAKVFFERTVKERELFAKVTDLHTGSI